MILLYIGKKKRADDDSSARFFLYTFIALVLNAPTIAEAIAITILRILSQTDFFIFFD